MRDSILQGLTGAVAGILFCIAVTLLLFELNTVKDMEKAAGKRYETVTEKESDNYDGS